MPDGHMLDISELKEVRSNITAIRMMSSDNIEVKNIVNNMVNERDYSYTKQYQQSTQFSSPLRLRVCIFVLCIFLTLSLNKDILIFCIMLL